MLILNRYIGRTVVMGILLVLLILLGVESFLELATQLKDVGKGSFHFLQAAMSVPLMLPTDVYELFPMAALIGSLMGLGRLANQSELIVMSAAGMSRWQIMKSLLITTALLILFVTLIGEIVAPRTRYFAKEYKTLAMSSGQTFKSASGVWFRDGPNFIFVRDIYVDNRLTDVTRYHFDADKRLTLVSHAYKGLYKQGSWYFRDVHQSEIFPDHIVSKTLPMQKWDIHLDKRLLGVSNISPDQMSLTRLHSYIKYRRQNDLGMGIYEFQFWKRLSQPITSLVMVFLAIPFIFGPLRTVSMGLRVVIGVVAGFSFYILNQFFGPISQVYQIPAILAAVLPTITFALIGTFLLFLRS